MSRSKPQVLNVPKSARKNKVKERLEVVESVMSDGVDRLIGEIQRVDSNISILADALENIDNTLSALRLLLVEKGLVTDADIERKVQFVQSVRQKAKQKTEQPEYKPQEPENPFKDVDPDLLRMKRAAESAGGEHPDDAFIFGG